MEFSSCSNGNVSTVDFQIQKQRNKFKLFHWDWEGDCKFVSFYFRIMFNFVSKYMVNLHIYDRSYRKRLGFKILIFLVHFGLKCLDSNYFQNWRLKFCRKLVFFSPLNNWFINCHANHAVIISKTKSGTVNIIPIFDLSVTDVKWILIWYTFKFQ